MVSVTGSILPRMTDIEARERNRAPALRPGEIDLGAERQQRRREIAAVGREAHAAALRRDVADVAGGLEAMVIGRTPPFALVVEDAARVEAEIAADRAHVAMRRPGDVRGGLRDHRIVRDDVRMLGSSLSVTDAPISSDCASALIARNSSTRFTSISTGGATMPRRMLTTRSVPPPSNRLSGCAARAVTTSSSDFGLQHFEFGQRIHHAPSVTKSAARLPYLPLPA